MMIVCKMWFGKNVNNSAIHPLSPIPNPPRKLLTLFRRLRHHRIENSGIQNMFWKDSRCSTTSFTTNSRGKLMQTYKLNKLGIFAPSTVGCADVEIVRSRHRLSWIRKDASQRIDDNGGIRFWTTQDECVDLLARGPTGWSPCRLPNTISNPETIAHSALCDPHNV